MVAVAASKREEGTPRVTEFLMLTETLISVFHQSLSIKWGGGGGGGGGSGNGRFCVVA